MLQLHFFPLAVRIAALTVAIGPLLAISADARPGGGGGGGFHMGGGGGFHRGGGGFGGIGRPMMHSAPMNHAPTVRSFSGMHSAPRFASPGLTNGHVTTQHLVAQHLATTHVNTVQGAITHTNLVSHPVQGAGHVSALRNNTFASLHNGANRALTNATFRGRFAGQNWHNFNGGWYWHNHFPVIIVVGWWGPVFWPWAWWDFIDFAFWPYAYDVFWPYAYDDIYWGLYGPYAYPDPAYVTAPSGGRYATRAARTARAAATGGEVCSDRVPTLTDWPIEQITKTVEPNGDQQTLLADLKDATAKALDALQAACPNDLPSTPTGRLAVMRTRVEAMLQAVGIVRPALDHLYNSLSDEQKARFNALTPEAQPGRRVRTAQAAGSGHDITQLCTNQAAKPTEVPTQRIAQALHPTDAQRSALDALDDATIRAADLLRTNCPADESLTPPGRVTAMEQRLNTMLQAIKIVQPALDNFYGTLTDEQKARFNELGARQNGA